MKTMMRWALAGAGLISIAGLSLTADQAPAPQANPTYTKDVAPILFRNCTSCHRPGEIAPMSLMTYDDVRPHAKDIRDEVSEGHMPPWHAEAPKGTFLNERGLSQEEKNTLFRWVATGAARGDAKDMPPVPTYPDGWSIGTPDVIFEMQEAYKVPADGTIEYQVLLHPDEFHRTEVDSGDRAAPWRSRGRASCPGVLSRSAGHAAPAGSSSKSRTNGAAAPAQAGPAAAA